MKVFKHSSLVLFLGLAIVFLASCAVPLKRECLKGDFLTKLPSGMDVAFGNVELCGDDLSFSGVYGPSFEKTIDLLKRDLKELKEGGK